MTLDKEGAIILEGGDDICDPRLPSPVRSVPTQTCSIILGSALIYSKIGIESCALFLSCGKISNLKRLGIPLFRDVTFDWIFVNTRLTICSRIGTVSPSQAVSDISISCY